jgi:chemotaxis response regulator CheB
VNRTRTIAFLVPDRKRVGGVDRTVRTRDTEGVVVQSFTDDGTRSIRNVADILNQSKNTVQNILKGNHMPESLQQSSTSIIRRLCTSKIMQLQEHEENTGFFCKCESY